MPIVGKIRRPFGAEVALSLTATGDQNLTIETDYTRVDGVTVEATADRTINLTIDASVNAGAKILFELKTNGTENSIFGTNITGPTNVGVAGKTINILFIYNGTAFVQAGASVQID